MDRRFATYAKIDISNGDFQRLAPGRWFNDRIIEVYSKWVMNKQTSARIRDQVHLASPFLYRKIAQAIPNEKLLLRQAQRNQVAEKKCLIIPICEQAHWRLWIVAHPDLTADASAIYVIDSLENYPTEEIASHIRRYIHLLNRGKHGQDFPCNSQSLPLRKVQVSPQANHSDCGVYLLRNLEEAYLQQDEARWDPHALSLAWCTAAEAQRSRMKIAAALLERAAMEGEARVSAKEPIDDADDVTIITPTAEPITVRTMTTEEPASMTTAKETMKPWTNEEPISLGVIVANNHDDDLLRITPTIGLLGSAPATPGRILGEGDEQFYYLSLLDDNNQFLHIYFKRDENEQVNRRTRFIKALPSPKLSVSIAYYKRNVLNAGFHNFHDTGVNVPA
uniref:Ubiquitin-like protease family profile domain-containing protein n=1 Tax=Glossina palpalis gambiensis TaxID=67801 RepID=A0A1B0BTX3_9MUSC